MPNGLPTIPGFTVTGTPITSALGTGAAVGNALTISGITFQPSTPGYSLTSYTVGPGIAEGFWSGPAVAVRRGGTVAGDVAAGPVADSGAGGGAGGDPAMFDADIFSQQLGPGGNQIPVASWVMLALIVAGLLKR